jgi:murein DD-endopeptidase MepM/ murein hydrolase activator NlpD
MPGTAAARIALIFLAASLCVPPAAPAFQKDIRTKQDQLEKIRKEISGYEKKIRDREKKENLTLDQLDDYGKQEVLLKRLVKKLHAEEADLEASIEQTTGSVAGLEAQIARLKAQYAAYVRNAYTRGPAGDLETLVASQSVTQLFTRAEYLKRFSAQRRRDLDSIQAKRKDLRNQQDLLSRQLGHRQRLIADKSAEQTRLHSATTKKKTLLASIRQDKKNFQKEIDRRKKDFQELESKIAALIEADKKKAPKPGSKAPAPAGGGAFEASRGGLGWPVDGGRLISKYGTHEHPVLKTITENKGVDISVPIGSRVSTVAAGEVSTIWWLPSFGNLIIVAHEGGYRTVYAHLGDIDVEEGQKVTAGQELGRSGEGLGGPMVHFEVWKGRETVDPEKWLRARGITKQ